MANSLLEGAAFFTGLELVIDRAAKAAVARSARLIRDEARRVLGTYDYGWEPLAEATIEHKATGDSPLLETGKLRKSIRYSVDGRPGHWVATVGSNDPKALYHELGTSRIPARSFLAGAAMQKESEIHKICGHDVFTFAVTSKHPDFEDEWSYDGED
jgi:phage gpG-like protein